MFSSARPALDECADCTWWPCESPACRSQNVDTYVPCYLYDFDISFEAPKGTKTPAAPRFPSTLSISVLQRPAIRFGQTETKCVMCCLLAPCVLMSTPTCVSRSNESKQTLGQTWVQVGEQDGHGFRKPSGTAHALSR